MTPDGSAGERVRRLAPALAAIVLLAIVVALSIAALRGDGAETSMLGGEGEAAELSRIRETLERIAERLDALAVAPPAAAGSLRDAQDDATGAPARPERELVPGGAAADAGQDALLRAIEEQGRQTREALARLAGLQFQSLAEVRRRKTVVDEQALRTFADLYATSADAAKQQALLLSPQELLAWLGPPDRIDGEGTSWSYYLPRGAELPATTVGFNLSRGYVDYCYVSMRR